MTQPDTPAVDTSPEAVENTIQWAKGDLPVLSESFASLCLIARALSQENIDLKASKDLYKRLFKKVARQRDNWVDKIETGETTIAALKARVEELEDFVGEWCRSGDLEEGNTSLTEEVERLKGVITQTCLKGVPSDVVGYMAVPIPTFEAMEQALSQALSPEQEKVK